MTPVELAAIFGAPAGAIFGAGVAWGITRNRLSGHGARIAHMEQGLDDHKSSSSPHSMCPAHSSDLASIQRSVDEIKADVKTLNNRIFTMMQGKFEADA